MEQGSCSYGAQQTSTFPASEAISEGAGASRDL